MEVDEKIESNNSKPDFSSIRGKKALISPTHEQFDLLKKLLEQRIIDSGGETIFEIGTGDNEENGIEPDEYAASVSDHYLYVPHRRLEHRFMCIVYFRWPHFSRWRQH